MFKRVVSVIVMAMMIAGLAACSQEGPAEKAGKKVDETVNKIKKVFD